MFKLYSQASIFLGVIQDLVVCVRSDLSLLFAKVWTLILPISSGEVSPVSPAWVSSVSLWVSGILMSADVVLWARSVVRLSWVIGSGGCRHEVSAPEPVQAFSQVYLIISCDR